MIEEIIDFIKYECKECIMQKSGEKIKIKTKVILTKSPKERFVIDGFQLNEITITLTEYSYIIEIIDLFSKVWKSYAIKNNTAENALYCLKDFCNCLGFPKIIQSDNGLDYKNSLFKDYCESNHIKHIFSSPGIPKLTGLLK